MQQELSPKIQITILGNPSTGKSTFLEQVLGRPKPKANLNVDQELLNRKILGKGYEIKICEVNGAGRFVENQENKKIQVQVKDSDLAVIFFDVSNKQSFDDVARGWLGYATKVVEAKNLVLLAHKIDKQSVLTLKNMLQFATANKLELFFSSSKMNCKKVFDDIILWHESNTFSQLLCREKEQPKKENFLKKFLGIGSANQNQDEGVKNKIRLICQASSVRMAAIQKCLGEAQRAIVDQLKEYTSYVRMKLISEMEGVLPFKKEEETLEIETLFSQLKCKIQQLKTQLQKTTNKMNQLSQQKKFLQTQTQKLSTESTTLANQLSQKSSQLLTLTHHNENLQQKLETQMKKQMEYKEQIQKMKMREIQLGDRLAVLKRQVREKESEVEMEKVRASIGVSQIIFDTSVLETNRQLEARLQKLYQQIRDTTYTALYAQSKTLSHYPALHKNLTQILSLSQGKPPTSLTKIYEFHLCSNTNFHTFIDGQQKLLYVIALVEVEVVLVIYVVEAMRDFGRGGGGKGVFAVCRTEGEGREKVEIEIVQFQRELWKYDPLCLVFGNGEIHVKFTKDHCYLWPIDKKISNIKDKSKPIHQILGLPDRQQSQHYPIECLQIFKLDFTQI